MRISRSGLGHNRRVMLSRPPALETPRLRLVVLEAAELSALIAGDTTQASERAGIIFPAGWPTDPDGRDGLPWHRGYLERDEAQRAFRVRAVVDRGNAQVIGAVSLKGPPDRLGLIEIGWGIDPQYQLQGFAVEAATALANWASAQLGFKALIATIPDHNLPSQRVAARIGMSRTLETRRDLPVWLRAAP